MAVASGLCVGGNYLNQPLLDEFSRVFGVSSVAAASTVTVAQVTYGIGLFLIVPLGDKFDRRTMAVGLMVLTGIGHLIAGFAPLFAALVVGIAVAGFFSVATQILQPLASAMSEPSEAGKAVGTIMSGILAGMLLARAVSGGIAEIGNAQTPYIFTGAAILMLSVAMWFALPPLKAEQRLPFLQLWTSMGQLIAQEPRVRTRSLMSAATFCSLSCVLATKAHLLAGEPFGLTPGAIGLVSLGGLFGVLVARPVGNLVDTGREELATWLGIICLAASWVAFIAGSSALAWFVLGFILIDVGMQGVHVTSMNVLLSTFPHLRSRVSSIYMTTFFIGAAVGSALGVWAWSIAGWDGVVVVGVASTILTALVALIDRRLLRQAASS